MDYDGRYRIGVELSCGNSFFSCKPWFDSFCSTWTDFSTATTPPPYYYDPSTGGLDWWVWLLVGVGAVLILGAVTLAILLVRRRRNRRSAKVGLAVSATEPLILGRRVLGH